jgi:hypothetical protein
MKPPPLLIGATLVFWGWQSGFLLEGALMAVVLEGARGLRLRWEFSEEDFQRIWTFCALLFLAAAVYALTANEGPSELRGFFAHPSFFTQRTAGNAVARSAAALFRWLPMLFFAFIAAQDYSPRGGIPLRTFRLLLSFRWKKAQLTAPLPQPARVVNVSYAYFALCLFAAAIHASEDATFFWGACVLVGWGLWPLRSRRFRLAAWVAALALAILCGYYGQLGLGRLQGYLTNLNAQWLSSFSHRRFDPLQSRTELGQLGRLKSSGHIVARVTTAGGPPPPYLRETTYVAYRGRTWYAEQSETAFAVIKPLDEEGTTYRLVAKTNQLHVNIGCYLPGGKALLPLPSGTGQLENLLAFVLSSSPLGAVLDEGPGVVVFDADYGPGPTQDAAPDPLRDLAIPERELPAINQVATQLGLDGQHPAQAIRTLATYFADSFQYSTWQASRPRPTDRQTALTRFLLNTHKGHCEYFATAGVLLLRRAGVPTRYAVGYSVHEGSGKDYVVRERDAHAWCLAWDATSHVWHNVDFTPASWVGVEEGRASPLQFLSDLWWAIRFEISKFRWGQSHLRQYILWALIPVLLVLFYQIVFRARRRRRGAGPLQPETLSWPGLDSEFFLVERKLVQRGVTRPPSEPLSQWLQRVAHDPALQPVRAGLEGLLRLHYRYRFDPQGLSAAERAALNQEVLACLRQLDAGANRPSRA